jgi:hypothetical protein
MNYLLSTTAGASREREKKTCLTNCQAVLYLMSKAATDATLRVVATV